MLSPLFLACAALTGASPQEASGGERLVVRPETFATDVVVSEDMNAGVTKVLKQETLLRGLRDLDWDKVEASFTEDARGRFPMPGDGAPLPGETFLVRELDGLSLEPVGRAGIVAALRAHVDPWISVERAKLKFHRFYIDGSGEAGAVVASGHLMLAGPRVDGGRTELHATVDLRIVNEEGRGILISAIELVSGHTLTYLGEPFLDIGAAAGFRFGMSALNRELNQQFVDERQMLTVGGVSVIDWNDDGFWDLLATRRDQESVLFVNDGRGGFQREPLPIDVPRESPYSFLYVDLDGDGEEELVVGQVLGYRSGEAWFGLYTRDADGAWKAAPNAFPFRLPPGVRGVSIQSIVPADVDGDGDLDLFCCVHSDSRSGREEYNTVEAMDGGDNLLFINQGDLTFSEESDARGITGRQYTYVAQFFDFDGDGDLDLVEGNDYGPNWYYENAGEGRFERRPEHALSGRSSYTMGATLADLDADGGVDLHLSNMYSHAGQRIVQLERSLSPERRAQVDAMGRGNQLYRLGPDGEWTEVGEAFGVADSGWAWASIFFDVENDGDLDLFVTNGNTSNRDQSADDW